MRNISVFQTLFFGITVVIGLIAIGTYLLISSSTEDYAYTQVELSLYRQTLIVSSFMERDQSLLSEDNKKHLPILDKSEGERITIILKNGRVLFDSEVDAITMDNHLQRPEILKATDEGWGSSKRFSESLKKDMIYVATKVNFNDGSYGFVRISVPLDDHLSLLKAIQVTFLEGFLIAAFIGLIAVYFFTRGFAKILNRISEFAIAIADENPKYKADFKLKMPKELSNLVIALNDTARRMQKLFKRINREKQKLNGILEDITQGLVVISKKNKIYLANFAAREILGSTTKEKIKYWDTLTDKKLVESIKKVQKTQKATKFAWNHNHKFYDVNLKFFPKTGETFIIFNDITEFIALENTKKEFVANISHELRTPLTVIKGFLEGVEDGKMIPEKHLGIIQRNTDRLIIMVEDLLALSILENEKIELQPEIIDITSLLIQVVDVFSAQANAKGLTIEMNKTEIIYINGDVFNIEAVVFNLLSNAIKYTEKGKISIKLYKKDNSIAISVKDTGIGIPESLKEKIFERFYVVDKSRSRKSGGTGLGLSIVKHIIRLHDGRIEVNSELNKGSEFVVYFPIIKDSLELNKKI